MRWVEDYRSKCTTSEKAVAEVKSNNRVYISGNAATPYPLLDALAKRKDELKDVELVHVLLLGDDPLSKPEMAGHFRHNSLFVGPADREAVNAGRADYIPIHLHRIPFLFLQRILSIDVAIIQTSPPDEHGFMSLGVEVLCSKAAVESAQKVIVQVNERMPRTLGDSFIHVSKATHIVEITEELPELKRRPPTDVEEKIGGYIAGLLEDGITLQLGIGGIPDAVLKALGDKKDLGVHTEMVSDGVMEAIESGVITGNKKSVHLGKVVATFVFGSKALYEYVNDNPIFELHPTDYTNDPFVISRNDNMVAINSAIEVDLTGQVCSDSIGPYIYSGFGGQVDFIRGASAAKDGKPIIALPATAQKDRVSRIVPVLKVGAGVVTSRADVHYVVTEYGVASLFGKNLRERTKALIEIAHPDFRENLTRGARERRFL